MADNRPKTDSGEKLQLEDLLRLKRCEKPDEQFWDTFEQRFEAKRWQALQRSDAREEAVGGRWNFVNGMRMTLAGAVAAAFVFGLVAMPFHFQAESRSANVVAVHDYEAVVPSKAPILQISATGEADVIIADGSEAHAGNADYVIDVINLATAAPVNNFERVMETQVFRTAYDSSSEFVADSLNLAAGGYAGGSRNFF